MYQSTNAGTYSTNAWASQEAPSPRGWHPLPQRWRLLPYPFLRETCAGGRRPGAWQPLTQMKQTLAATSTPSSAPISGLSARCIRRMPSINSETNNVAGTNPLPPSADTESSSGPDEKRNSKHAPLSAQADTASSLGHDEKRDSNNASTSPVRNTTSSSALDKRLDSNNTSMSTQAGDAVSCSGPNEKRDSEHAPLSPQADTASSSAPDEKRDSKHAPLSPQADTASSSAPDEKRDSNNAWISPEGGNTASSSRTHEKRREAPILKGLSNGENNTALPGPSSCIDGAHQAPIITSEITNSPGSALLAPLSPVATSTGAREKRMDTLAIRSVNVREADSPSPPPPPPSIDAAPPSIPVPCAHEKRVPHTVKSSDSEGEGGASTCACLPCTSSRLTCGATRTKRVCVMGYDGSPRAKRRREGEGEQGEAPSSRRVAHEGVKREMVKREEVEDGEGVASEGMMPAGSSSIACSPRAAAPSSTLLPLEYLQFQFSLKSKEDALLMQRAIGLLQEKREVCVSDIADRYCFRLLSLLQSVPIFEVYLKPQKTSYVHVHCVRLAGDASRHIEEYLMHTSAEPRRSVESKSPRLDSMPAVSTPSDLVSEGHASSHSWVLSSRGDTTNNTSHLSCDDAWILSSRGDTPNSTSHLSYDDAKDSCVEPACRGSRCPGRDDGGGGRSDSEEIVKNGIWRVSCRDQIAEAKSAQGVMRSIPSFFGQSDNDSYHKKNNSKRAAECSSATSSDEHPVAKRALLHEHAADFRNYIRADGITGCENDDDLSSRSTRRPRRSPRLMKKTASRPTVHVDQDARILTAPRKRKAVKSDLPTARPRRPQTSRRTRGTSARASARATRAAATRAVISKDDASAPDPKPRRSNTQTLCSVPQCTTRAQFTNLINADHHGPAGPRCKRHGGGRRCNVPTCNEGRGGPRSAQRMAKSADEFGAAGPRCVRHSGERCNLPSCTTSAQGRIETADSWGNAGWRCKRHGGGVRCNIDNCRLSSQGASLLDDDQFGVAGPRCLKHGGGRRRPKKHGDADTADRSPSFAKKHDDAGTADRSPSFAKKHGAADTADPLSHH